MVHENRLKIICTQMIARFILLLSYIINIAEKFLLNGDINVLQSRSQKLKSSGFTYR